LVIVAQEASVGAVASPASGSRWSSISIHALGGVLGGLSGASIVILITLGLKAGMEFVAGQSPLEIIGAPLVGLALSVLALQGIGRSETTPPAGGWRAWVSFPPGAIRADITGDVVATAGEEERFPWRLAPLRCVAVFATVGLGGPMGTEAPAVYFGMADGAWLADHGRWWRRLLRPAALGGGAAGVAALMGIPLVGTAYLLELGTKHKAPLTAERLVAATIGGIIGWGLDVIFKLSLIRLVVPKEPPDSFLHALVIALFIGAISGAITSLTGTAVYRGKKWKAAPLVRLLLGGLALAATAMLLTLVASPQAASGPGGGAILWAERDRALPLALLVVALLRGAATAAAAAAGGCGGIFVPFLAVGDLAGRVFAPAFGVGHDLAGAAGAAGGIAGGYRLPFTAIAMVLGYGGPRLATLTCLATVAVAFFAGQALDVLLERLKRLAHVGTRVESH
jgi:H+/Cl- antiporter ClcA